MIIFLKFLVASYNPVGFNHVNDSSSMLAVTMMKLNDYRLSCLKILELIIFVWIC